MMTPGRLAGVFVIALLFPALGSADPITGLVIFGDRLPPPPNLPGPKAIHPPVQPPPGSVPNVPPWVEQLASKLGVPPPLPSLKGGLNYAYGSSQSGTGAGLTLPTLDTQVHTFLASHTPAPGQLFVLGGPAGVLGGQTDPATAAAKVCGEINTLAQAGASHFLVFSLPPLPPLPPGAKLSPADQKALNARITDYDSCLEKDLSQLRAQWPGISVDTQTITSLLHPKDKHSTDPGSSGLTGSSVGTAADTAPEPGSLSLAGLGALGLAAYGWRRRKLAA